MPKMKTRKCAAKRFKSSKSGKFKRSKAYGAHLLTKKSSKRRRGFRKSAILSESDLKRVKARIKKRQPARGDSLVRIAVPSPRQVQEHFVLIDEPLDWGERAKPLIKVTNVLLEGAQRGFWRAVDKGVDNVKLMVDRQLKTSRAYHTFTQIQGFRKRQKMIKTGFSDRVEALAQRNLQEVRTVVGSYGTRGDQDLIDKVGPAERDAALRLAKKLGRHDADAAADREFAPIGSARRPVRTIGTKPTHPDFFRIQPCLRK